MGTGTIRLPEGITEINQELQLRPGAENVEISGTPGATLRAGRKFQGRAMLVIQDAKNVKVRGFQIDGNRTGIDRRANLPPSGTPFYQHFPASGILFINCQNVEVSGVEFREITGFAVLAAMTKKITVERVVVRASGSRKSDNTNNTTGGILFEEGTDDFTVRDSEFFKIGGNAIWTHSYHGSPRNQRGLITGNKFETIARDAIQVGHASKVRVENNSGRYIGYPFGEVDIAGQGIPVGIDTAGDVDASVYADNHFSEINGKCFDLDGFHDGEVRGNTCVNQGGPEEYPNGNYMLVMNNTYPEMRSELITISGNTFDGGKYGGIFAIGKRHRITGNKLRRMNTSRCNESGAAYQCLWSADEPAIMQAGIFLGARAERIDPSEAITVEGNEIRGHKMAERCVMTSKIVLASKNAIRHNTCISEDPK